MFDPWVAGYAKKRTLVTGGAGFIGSHLVSKLIDADSQVTVFDNNPVVPWPNLTGQAGNYTRCSGDVRNAVEVERLIKELKPEFVFHLAANASVPLSAEDPRYDFETNCLGTFTFLECLRKYAPSVRMVLASSGAVYGEPGFEPVTEVAPLAPISPYGASKLSAEVESRLFAQLFGVDVVIGRIFNSYGPRMPRFVVLDFLRKLKRSKVSLEILGSGRQTRDFTFVDDTVTGLLVLGANGIRGEAYNIASGISYSVTDLAHHLLDTLGLDKTAELIYTGGSWPGDAQYWAVDIQKIQNLGFEPRHSLQDGLSRVISWFEELEGKL